MKIRSQPLGGISSQDRAELGIVVTFENADGDTYSRHRSGSAIQSLRELRAEALEKVTASPSNTAVRRDTWAHGTDSGYRKGCRCETCSEAHSEACRNAHQRRKHKGVLREAGVDHGTVAAYTLGCRCASCSSLHKKLECRVA